MKPRHIRLHIHLPPFPILPLPSFPASLAAARDGALKATRGRWGVSKRIFSLLVLPSLSILSILVSPTLALPTLLTLGLGVLPVVWSDVAVVVGFHICIPA